MLPFPNFLSRQDRILISFLSKRNFHHTNKFRMPLIVPGITPQGGEKSKTEEWSNKLVGKKLGEGSDTTVCLFHSGPGL